MTRPWLVLYRRTSTRTGNPGKWRVQATYATRNAAVDALLAAAGRHVGGREPYEAKVRHRDKRKDAE